MPNILSISELEVMDRYWRAVNYLSVGQIHLYDNALLKEPLKLEHVKPRLLGHWGTTPGLNFIYAHLTRMIKKYDLDMIYVCGPGHGGPGMVANTYLEGTYANCIPRFPRMKGACRNCLSSFPSLGEFPVMPPRKLQVPFTRAASLATLSPMPLVRP